jgi:hypothetical protein
MHGRLLAVSATNRYRQSFVVEIAARSRRDGHLPCALYMGLWQAIQGSWNGSRLQKCDLTPLGVVRLIQSCVLSF